jgi:hypothetical protein
MLIHLVFLRTWQLQHADHSGHVARNIMACLRAHTGSFVHARDRLAVARPMASYRAPLELIAGQLVGDRFRLLVALRSFGHLAGMLAHWHVPPFEKEDALLPVMRLRSPRHAGAVSRVR